MLEGAMPVSSTRLGSEFEFEGIKPINVLEEGCLKEAQFVALSLVCSAGTDLNGHERSSAAVVSRMTRHHL